MPKIKNTNPLGAVEVPLLGFRVLEPGETVEVTDEQAEKLLHQVDNYSPVDKAAKTIHARITAPAEEPADDAAAQQQDEAGAPAEEVTE